MDKIIDFFKEAYEELKKVTWLSRKEVVGSTIVIIILISLLSVFVAFIDFILLKLVGLVL